MFKLFRKKSKLVKYPKPMSADEVAQAFGDVGDGSKFWQALDTVIDSALLDSVNDVADPASDPQKMSHAAGRIDALATLKTKIEEFKKWKNGKIHFNQN